MRDPAPRPPIVGRNGVTNSNQEKADALSEYLDAQLYRLTTHQTRCTLRTWLRSSVWSRTDPWMNLNTWRLNKARQWLGILGPLLNRRSALSTRNGLTLYKQLLRPIINYACHAWGHLADTYMRRMQVFQSVCLRIILGVPWYVRNETLHRDLDMPTIKDHFRGLAQSFYSRLPGATNPLIKGLGKYVIDPGGCHRLPKALLG
uniref:Reverse transcriptase n=1 Tax=Timema monikensis TaxID=170555 RepID=A0A7R9DZF7_9NEOP|nr:unnamed protein product [Timema monikensis]